MERRRNMYLSRLHATNGIVSIAIDALNGEMLEFVRESTADNVMKNHVRETRSLLDGLLLGKGEPLRFFVPRYEEIRVDPSLKPELIVEQAESSAELTLRYPALVSGGKKLALSAEVKIRLPEGEERSLWTLKLENHTGMELDDVAFPAVDGVWLGESWKDDTLVYPQFAGCRLDDPTDRLAEEPVTIRWKWQEYVYGYHLGQACGVRDERGAYVLRLNYSGPASMLWMDLFDREENTGLYITCRNAACRMKSLRMESFGPQKPGVGLAILHRPGVTEGVWQSEECVLALHGGDWHWAADEYRTWTESLPRRKPLKRPDWFLKSPGLMAHYDFQYQGGGIVHTFHEIPTLMRQAMEAGMNHILLSGWNEDGFDYGFPHYTPNHNLGTEEELKAAVAECRRMGGHVSFYVNSRLCNVDFEDQRERIRKSAVMNRDGGLKIESYGAADVRFASLCINEPDWRHALAETVRYLTRDVGADSIYLDQLAMADSCKCYHPGHVEHAGDPCAWNQGYGKLLEEIERNYDPETGMALFYEGCNDAFGPYCSAQLVTELSCPLKGRMPEVFKYTFPDQILTDMMNPRRNSAMRPEHVARLSTELLHNAFTMGAYFWCYDLEWDNTWRRDPEQHERLRKLCVLRRAWLENYGQGRFTDTVGVGESPEGALVKRFLLDDGAVLLACADEKGLRGETSVEWTLPGTPAAYVRTMEAPEEVRVPCLREEKEGKTFVRAALPESDAAVIVFRPA